MKLSTILILTLIGFISFTSCTPTKVASSDGSVKARSAQYLIKKLNNSSIDYDWFSARSKIKYVGMDQNRSVRASIRIRKDSMIWMSLTLFGLEGARVKITPDSVYLINRLEKQYVVKPLNFVEETFNLPADYSNIEAMLVGNPVILENNTYDVSIKDNQYFLKTEQPVKTTYILKGNNFEYSGFILQDDKKQKMDMTLSDYQEIEKRNFSYFRDILLSSPNQGSASVEISYSKVEFDKPKKMSFKVPDSYKRVQ